MKLTDAIFVKESERTEDDGSVFEDFGMKSDQSSSIAVELAKELVFGNSATKTDSLKYILENSKLVDKLVKDVGKEKALFVLGISFARALDMGSEVSYQLKSLVSDVESEKGIEVEKTLYIPKGLKS